MKFISIKKTEMTESKYSKVSKMTKETSNERNQFSNNNSFIDIRSQVYQSLELDTNFAFSDSSNSSEFLSDSTVSGLCRQMKKNEDIDLVSSSYEHNLSSSFSISMPYIFNQSNLKCPEESLNHTLSVVMEVDNTHDDSEIFACIKRNNLNLSEKSNSDSDEDSKNLSCVVDEGNTTPSFNFVSRGETLNSGANLFTPKSLKNNERKFNCPHCFKSFGIPSSLKRHIKTHNIKMNDSELVGGTTSLESVLIKNKSVDFDSETCKKRQNALHRQKYAQCPNCLKSFKCPSKLLRHIKTHVGLKSYTCHLCSKAFLEKFNLIAHMRIHRNEQPYNCEKCERAFSIKSNLKRHMQSHMRKEQFTCCKCGKGCSSEKKLALHFRTHEKIPPKCPECGKIFQKNANLNRHLKIHSNEREHSCDFCDYKAGQFSHLERHVQRNHKK